MNPAALVVSFPEPNYAGWTNRYYEMVLNQDPTQDVTVTIAGGTPNLSLITTSHTFTTGNWNSAAKIYFDLADDTADYDSTVTHSMSSANAAFNGIANYSYND